MRIDKKGGVIMTQNTMPTGVPPVPFPPAPNIEEQYVEQVEAQTTVEITTYIPSAPVPTSVPTISTDEIDLDELDEQIEGELKTTVTVAIQTDVLKSLISKVERAVSKRTTIEIFKFIYMDFQEHKIIVRAVNSDYTSEAFVDQLEDKSNFAITDGKPGTICFPADKLIPIVKRLNSKNSSITITQNVAVFKSGRPKFDLNGVDGTEFPRTPDTGESEATISIHPNVLSMMYDRTIYAASTKESRAVLIGVHHKIEDNFLTCVSTDSHRLGQYVYELDGEYENVSRTIPASILSEAKKHLDATEKEVKVHFCKSHVVYEYENVTLYARVLEDKYPATDRLIFSTEQAGSSFVIHAGMFKTLLDNSTVYNPDQPIIIRIKPELNQLRVNTREAGIGAFQEDLAITEGQGADLVLAVNVRYLQEAFSKYNTDSYVKFEFMPATEQKPAGMQPFKSLLKNGSPDCLELFVPVRTDQVKYKEEVVIDNFQGIPEFEFDPFEKEFKEIE